MNSKYDVIFGSVCAAATTIVLVAVLAFSVRACKYSYEAEQACLKRATTAPQISTCMGRR
jgi:uncharacterized protein YsxB (DUF464 family)